MTTFPNSPRLFKGGLILLDADTSAVQRVIVLQYNPDTLSRTLQPQTVKESGDRSEAMRLTGPPVETIKRFLLLDKELDEDDGELTATQKVRRSIIGKKFAREIELIYGGGTA